MMTAIITYVANYTSDGLAESDLLSLLRFVTPSSRITKLSNFLKVNTPYFLNLLYLFIPG
jgi:hypothetical protein